MLFDIIGIKHRISLRIALEQCASPEENVYPLGSKQYLKAVLLAAALTTAASQPCFAASSLKVLYQLPGGNGGEYPVGNLYQDKSGNLYGTSSGLIQDAKKGIDLGTVFELSPPTSPGTGWKSQIIYAFKSKGDGSYPACGLVADSSGALYGTAQSGGSTSGVVFKLTPPASGQTAWTEEAIFAPQGFPIGNVLLGKNGVLYAVSSAGVYSITPPKDGQGAWTGNLLAPIPLNANPTAGVAADSNGVLYYTTEYGGNGNGVVYSLTPPANGQTGWAQGVVYQFQGSPNDGARPAGNLVVDKTGAIYGTTIFGGSGVGTVYKLSPPADGQSTWSETILYSFTGEADGGVPNAGLTMLPNGNFYGTAGGGSGKNGLIYKLTPTVGNTGYTFSLVYSFPNRSAKSPLGPEASVIRGNNGALFGTTIYGGNVKPPCKPAGCGTVYEVLP